MMKVSRLGGWSPISPAMKPETVEQWAQRWAKALSDKKGKCDVCGARFTKGMAVKGLKQHANGKPHQKARVRMDLARLLEVHASETIPIHMGTLPERYRQETGRALKQDLEQAGLGKKLRAALEQLRDICDIGEVPSPAGPNHPPAVVMFRVLPVTERSLGPEPELELEPEPEPPDLEYDDASSDDTLSVASTFGTVDTETTLHSIETADMPLTATHHIEERQEQRNVSTLEIQHAIKHGEVYALDPTADGRARYGIADREGLLIVITDASLMTGITVINCTNAQQRWTRVGQLDDYIRRCFGAELATTARRAVKEGIQAAFDRITQLESQGSDDSDGEDYSDEDFPSRDPDPEPELELEPEEQPEIVFGREPSEAEAVRMKAQEEATQRKSAEAEVVSKAVSKAESKAAAVEQWAQRWAKALSVNKGKCDVCGAKFTKGMTAKALKDHANGKPHQKGLKPVVVSAAAEKQFQALYKHEVSQGEKKKKAEAEAARMKAQDDATRRKAEAEAEAARRKVLNQAFDITAAAQSTMVFENRAGVTSKRVAAERIGEKDEPIDSRWGSVQIDLGPRERTAAPQPEPQGSDLHWTSSEEDGQSDEDSEEDSDDCDPESEPEPEPERGTLEYMAREVITQLVGMRSAIIMDATVVSLAAVAVKGWEVKRDALYDAVYNTLPDGWSVTGKGKHRKVKCVIGPVQADTQLTPAMQVNVQEAVAQINAPIKSMVKLRAFDVLTTSHLLAEPGSAETLLSEPGSIALKRCFSKVSELVAIVPFFGRPASGLRAVLLKPFGQAGVAGFVQALRQSWVYANHRAPIELAFGPVVDPSMGPTVAQVNLLLTPVTQRESISGQVAYTDGAFDKCTVDYKDKTLSVRFVPAVMDPDPLMEEAAAEARKKIARAVGNKCQMAVKNGTTTIHAKLKKLDRNMIIKVATICKKHAPGTMIECNATKNQKNKKKKKSAYREQERVQKAKKAKKKKENKKKKKK